MPGGFLNGSAAGSFFFIGSFGKFKTGKNFIIGFGVFINQGDEFFLESGGKRLCVLHYFFTGFISFLADGESRHHRGQSGSQCSA